jgi:BirA family biotin operon repressor/biotin-[acetyl-CoA-carboxylase] ligase
MFNIAEISEQWAIQEGVAVHKLESVESTNSYAKDQISKNENFPLLILAGEQTAGRGRGSNTWTSTGNGESLICSIVFKIDKSAQPIATPCFGWAVYRALNESFGLNFSVKIPNDIYIEDAKVGGILLESVTQGDEHHLILGLGINVFSHPSVDNSGSIVNFTEDEDVQENQWIQFLSLLMSFSNQAAIASTEENMSEIIVEELERAVKNYTHNEIESLSTDGGFTLSDGVHSNWREL